MAERRQFPRAPLVVKVVNTSTKEFHYFYSRDISQGGMFLETRTPYAIGTEVGLDFILPLQDKKERIGNRGKVARVIEYDRNLKDEQISGMGVEFVGLGSEQIGIIAKYVRESSE